MSVRWFCFDKMLLIKYIISTDLNTIVEIIKKSLQIRFFYDISRRKAYLSGLLCKYINVLIFHNCNLLISCRLFIKSVIVKVVFCVVLIDLPVNLARCTECDYICRDVFGYNRTCSSMASGGSSLNLRTSVLHFACNAMFSSSSSQM